MLSGYLRGIPAHAQARACGLSRLGLCRLAGMTTF